MGRKEWMILKKGLVQETIDVLLEADMGIGPCKIIARNISKTYKSKNKEVLALKNINIKIKDNEFACIVGPSGCGKSTLLRILAGLDFPTNGEILVNNKIVRGPGADRGMVFQSYTLFPWLTVEDNIRFGLEIKKLNKNEADAIVDRYLERIHLTKFRKSYPKELSGGMKQRVAIAKALANSPEVLLMDEPFGALDPHTKQQMQLLLREIWEVEKPTIVFITHDIEEAVFLANKIYIMSTNPGEIMKEQLIDLPCQRNVDLKDNPKFISIRKEIDALLYPHDEYDM